MTPSLCLSVIARNESARLEKHFKQLMPYLTEAILIDTSSTDDTIEVAQKLGFRTFEFTPTTNPEAFFPDPDTQRPILADFAAARQLSFDKANSEFIMWADCDDLIVRPENLSTICRTMNEENMNVGLCKYYTMLDRVDRDTWLWRARIIRNGRGYKWEGRVHEVIPLKSEDYNAFHAVQWQHQQYSNVRSDVVGIKRRNYKILKHLYDSGDHSFRTIYYLGVESVDQDDGEALGWLREAIEIGKSTYPRPNDYKDCLEWLQKVESKLQIERMFRNGI